MRWRAILPPLLLLFAGCTSADVAHVEPPEGTEWTECPPLSSRGIAVPFHVEATNDADNLGPGIHRVSPRDFVWVWARYEDTLHEDRVTRVNAVDVARDADGVVHVCTRVDLATPLEVDTERGSYTVAIRMSALDELPEGPLRVAVNWVAGCRCDPLPRGNTTASFD